MKNATKNWLVTTMACAMSAGALAQQADPVMASVESATLAARADSMPRVEVTSSSLPRLDGLEASSGQRLDLTLLPPRRNVGLALGLGNFQNQPPQALTGQPLAAPNLDVGLLYRHTTEGNRIIDVTAWRRVQTQPDVMTLVNTRQAPVYGARVEMNLAGGMKTGLLADKGFVGVQLENGARLSLKRKDGGAMVYYRQKFF